MSGIKVVIDLPGDSPLGWKTERLWAERTGRTTAVLDNIPFHARGYALGDEVRIERDARGEFRVTGVVVPSGNCTIRVLPIEPPPEDEFRDLEVQAGVRAVFAPLGVDLEMAGPSFANLICLNVAPACDLAAVRRALDEGERSGRWMVDEASVTPDWRALDAPS